jgi:phage shock protein PspC (stress-responsive transcriptional regulator)
MSEDTTLHPGAVPAEAERRLVRPADGRLVAGVSAGLARYFGLSPLVYRVAFAALVLLGGSGLVLYGIAWFVIPDERRGASIVEEAIRDRRRRPWLAVGVALVAIGLAAALADGIWPDRVDLIWLAVIGVGLSLVSSYVGDGTDSASSDPLSATETDVATPPAREQPPQVDHRRRFPIVLPVVGATIAAAGILAVLDATDVVDVDWTVALSAIVVVIGVAVAVGAFFGNVGWLAAIGVLLASVAVAFSAIDLPLHGPIGDRTERPVSVAQLEDDYEQSIGQLTVDLTDLALPPGTTEVNARVGIGDLVVRIPAGARVDVTADVTAGEAEVFGATRDGWNTELDVVEAGASADAPTIVLDADVGFGHLEVLRG